VAKDGKGGFTLTYNELLNLSIKYPCSKENEKKNILIKVWGSDGRRGLELLSSILGYPYDYLYIKGDIEYHRVKRNRSRRGRTNPAIHRMNKNYDELEIAEVAREAALGGMVSSSGGKRTTRGSGNIKDISIAQSYQALLGQ
jgi:hypothetical protein